MKTRFAAQRVATPFAMLTVGSLHAGSEKLQVPLARVVIGGLLTSTMITLVFVPAMYTLFEEGWRGIFKRGTAAPAPAGH